LSYDFSREQVDKGDRCERVAALSSAAGDGSLSRWSFDGPS
jgi:hypothetical protein